jgi:hypothetical protein
MTLPVSGAISINNINVELGVSGTTNASLGQSSFRALAGVSSGAISMSNFYGKANEFEFTIASNQTNANLRTLAINAGWNQSAKVIATINGGIYISSNGVGTPALTVNGSFPNGAELRNNGFILGRGGNGGSGGSGSNYNAGNPGSAGGLALSVSVSLALNNAGTIGGGGGGAGGGGSLYTGDGSDGWAGGGGGGGQSNIAANSAGGAAGAVNNSQSSRYPQAGVAGTVSGAGGGGVGGVAPNAGFYAGNGGAGGGWGSAGAAGGSSSNNYPVNAGGSGGAGGAAISGNGNITYLATGTRLGAIT